MARGTLNQDHVFYRNPARFYPTVDRGRGVYLYDTDGKRYLDGAGGAALAAIGHGVKDIERAIARQLRKVAFTHGSQFTSEAAVTLAGRLVALAPAGLNRAYFVSGGSEAVETAVKLARQYQVDRGQPSRFKVISRWTSYHGNTLGALALSGHTGRRQYYLPLIGHTPHIVPAYCYRCPFGLAPAACALDCAADLEKTILYEGPESVSAFIAEPVVGATAGALVPPSGYFRKIREICDRYDVLFIADEVMTGLGRTGKAFAVDHWDVRPDLIAGAKGLGAGYAPIFAVLATEAIHETIRSGRGAFVHGHTYGQNPLACAAAVAVLEYIEARDLIARSAALGPYLLGSLARLNRHEIVGDIRGLGLFAGVEFVRDRASREPFPPEARVNTRIAERAFARGLIVYPGGGGADGIRGDHILIAPPFVITKRQIDALVRLLDEAVADIARETG